MPLITSKLYAAPAMLIAIALAACGGGGGDGAPSSGGQNTPPTISGQPIAFVVAAQSYSFQPVAADANGDRLSFTASNVPPWATFDGATGRLSGTPGSADVGTYSGITIAVTDGRNTVSIASFSITVSDVSNGAATLSWEAPQQNSDGSALADLAGYQIVYGQSTNELTNIVDVSAGLSSYVIENLSGGTWYFAVRAVNASGVTSALSNVASKHIG